MAALNVTPAIAQTGYAFWDGNDDKGSPVAAGIYVWVAVVDGVRTRGRLTFLR